MAELLTEAFIADVRDKLIPDGTFLTESVDYSQFVDNDKINIPIQGALPTVEVDKSFSGASDEVTSVLLDDTKKTSEMSVLNTQEVIVRDMEAVELSYDKLALVNRGHIKALQAQMYLMAAHAYAPASNAKGTPVLATSGKADSGDPMPLTFSDLIKMAEQFDVVNLPSDGRILLLNPSHLADLMNENISLYNQIAITKEIFDFKVYKSNATPLFDKTNGNMLAIGSSSSNKVKASVAWHKDYVMRVVGSTQMFTRENNSKILGTGINYAQRFKADSIMSLGQGAIYTKDAA